MAEESVSKIGSLKELTDEKGGDYSRWQSEIAAAEKELAKWQRGARKIVKEFRADRTETSGVDPSMERRFNLFTANVQIITAAMINQMPDPTVDRAFKDPQDDIGRVACEIMERALITHNYGEKMPGIFRQCVQDQLTAGLGGSWHTYHAKTEQKVEPVSKVEYEEVTEEGCKDEYVYWEDLLWSPARCYEELRWIGRKVYMTRDALKERFPKFGKDIPLDYAPKKSENSVESKNQVFQQAVIYEIWNKEDKQVIWFSKGMEELLDQKDDFLELKDFWPCPRLLVSTVSNGQYLPIPDYHYARDQYKELNEINTRVSLLVRACRVAGVYDKAAGQIQALLNNAAENTLIPVDQWAAFAEKGGVKGSIDWIPLDQIVAVLEQLLRNREDIKQQIYEMTGMADIIRGATKASETLGAQKIKTQYASIRIQERQKNIVNYVSSVFDIQCQLLRKHVDSDEIARLAQIEFMAEDAQLIQQALQLIKMPEFDLRACVEADTLSDIDFQAEKQDRIEYMTAITNFLKETMGTIQQDPVLGPFLIQLLQFSLAGFKVGKKFESQLDRTISQIMQKLQQPQQPQKSPDQQKADAEIQVMQQEAATKQQSDAADLQYQQQRHQDEMSFKAQEHDIKLQQVQETAQVKSQVAQQKLADSQQKHMQGMQQNEAQFWQRLRQQQAMPRQQPGGPQGTPPQA
jgi:hypothetical protein